ncbi:MAG: FAD-dependent oxidoreductase [Microlunatus sp.]|nr:FAD-dependent oxidoreductase [Microlunatus sp.]
MSAESSEDTTWDLLVVGGGTAGLVSAHTAAGFGARVLLVERARTGGDCLWTGCVPSKALLASASTAARARDGGRLGIDVNGVSVDFARVMAHVRAAIQTIEPVDSAAALTAAGVEVQTGELSFTGPCSATVDGQPVRFTQAIVCTGSSPEIPPIPGLSEVGPLTSDSIWDLEALPARLAVLGAGSVGCELGQAFARLGSTVTIVAESGRILDREDPEAAQLVAASLARDGVTLRTGTRVVRVTSRTSSHVLELQDGTEVGFDQVLVCAGVRPETGGLGLDRAGVELDEHSYVRVDSRLRTTNPDIWAAGDVTGRARFTHTAGVDGSVAASNAVLGLRRRIDTTVPRVTFTDPEVAAVGLGTGSAASESGRHVVVRDHAHLDRAITESDVDGFTKLVVDAGGRVLGATVVGPRAGESLGELSVAVRHGLRTRDLAATTHAYPTYSDAVWNASVDDFQARLRRPGLSHVLAVLVAGRRRWVRSSVRARLVQASRR